VAGVGLRLSGNDGRYRGWHDVGRPGDVVGVAELCRYDFVDAVVTRRGDALPPGDSVQVGSEKTKTVRLGGNQVIVVVDNERRAETGIAFRTITKEEARQY
jgi:hypothetical protein